jgi:hypothetical protein
MSSKIEHVWSLLVMCRTLIVRRKCKTVVSYRSALPQFLQWSPGPGSIINPGGRWVCMSAIRCAISIVPVRIHVFVDALRSKSCDNKLFSGSRWPSPVSQPASRHSDDPGDSIQFSTILAERRKNWKNGALGFDARCDVPRYRRHSSDRAFEQDLIDLLDIGLGNALIASQRNQIPTRSAPAPVPRTNRNLSTGPRSDPLKK